MKIHHTHTTPLEFIVTKKHITSKKTLKTSVLFDKVSLSADESLAPYKNILHTKPTTFDINFISNAYLNDEIIVKNTIQKLNNTDLELSVVAFKRNKKQHILLCKAIFGYHLKKAS